FPANPGEQPTQFFYPVSGQTLSRTKSANVMMALYQADKDTKNWSMANRQNIQSSENVQNKLIRFSRMQLKRYGLKGQANRFVPLLQDWNAAPLNSMSLKYYGVARSYKGVDAMLVEGYSTMLNHYAASVLDKVHLKQLVKKIEVSDGEI